MKQAKPKTLGGKAAVIENLTACANKLGANTICLGVAAPSFAYCLLHPRPAWDWVIITACNGIAVLVAWSNFRASFEPIMTFFEEVRRLLVDIGKNARECRRQFFSRNNRDKRSFWVRVRKGLGKPQK